MPSEIPDDHELVREYWDKLDREVRKITRGRKIWWPEGTLAERHRGAPVQSSRKEALASGNSPVFCGFHWNPLLAPTSLLLDLSAAFFHFFST